MEGKVNPSGKLPVTLPNYRNEEYMTDDQFNCGEHATSHYDEGLFIGYRWYDAHKKDPAFPFGHGLSYTQFKYDQ